MRSKNLEKKSLFKLIIKLWRHIDKKRQKHFFLLLLLMVVSAFTEVVSIAAILPFLGVLTAPEQIFEYQLVRHVSNYFGVYSADQLILPLTIIFVVLAVLAGLIRLVLLYVSTRLSHVAGSDLGVKIYSRILHQDYLEHLNRNSSDSINSIVNKTGIVIGGIVLPTLVLLSSTLLLVGVTVAIVSIDVVAAFSAIVSVGFFYWIVIYFSKNRLVLLSNIEAIESTKVIKLLQEGLGGIRDVLIGDNQQFYIDAYTKSELSLRHAQSDMAFIRSSPRFVMESVGMSIIAVLAYFLTKRPDGINTAIPVLGALALGAQRLLPALQQAYSSISNIRGASASFQDVLDLLDCPVSKHTDAQYIEPIAFDKNIVFCNLGFRYSENEPWVFRNINFEISKGARIGFIGKTGSGKSTLVDIVMGLLSASEGEMKVDGVNISRKNSRSWKMHISHVPQNIFLTDNTIEENIAFGQHKEKITHERICSAANQAQLYDLIDGLEDKYQTVIGENGARLSGGQRQRIGIARALYNKSDVIVFDEATSSLDGDTEKSVMEAIDRLSDDLTVLIIAHRIETLKSCDKIFKIEKGRIVSVGDYSNVAGAQA